MTSCGDWLCVSVQDLPGFWRALKEVILDVWTVLNGPERKAVQLALIMAFIDQGMASTAIVNYAPQVMPCALAAPLHVIPRFLRTC